MPPKNTDNSQLESRVAALEKQIAALSESSTIPLNIDTAFMGRGFLKTKAPSLPGDGSSYITNGGFRTDIFITGDPQVITVPSFPIRFFEVLNPYGSNLFIPANTYEELG